MQQQQAVVVVAEAPSQLFESACLLLSAAVVAAVQKMMLEILEQRFAAEGGAEMAAEVEAGMQYDELMLSAAPEDAEGSGASGSNAEVDADEHNSLGGNACGSIPVDAG